MKDFPFPDGKASFHPLAYVPPSEEINEIYDLHVNNGRLLEHFEQGNMTYRVPGVKNITPNIFLEVSPELAQERGLASGSFVRIENRYGQLKLRVLVTSRVQGKQMYLPMISTQEAVNKLTSMHVDRATHTPAYKELAVKMTVLEETGPSPLPRRNFRFGNPTPTTGGEGEKKWANPDYWLPGPAIKDKLVQIKTKEPS